MFRKMASDGSISKALKSVNDRIQLALSHRIRDSPQSPNIVPRLVAVSKTKPITDICEAYQCQQRHFGENYVNELVEKSRSSEIAEKCPDIRWHFIGSLQKTNVNKLVAVPNLFMVETIDSQKLANVVNRSWSRLNKSNKLKIMVQINTSAEENKNGCSVNEAVDLVRYIMNDCPQLQFVGLMTIGSFDHDISKAPNPDFQSLVKCGEVVSRSSEISNELELSMGMSNDFEHAITLGSTNVRVGSTIFGARIYPNKSKSSTLQENKQKIDKNGIMNGDCVDEKLSGLHIEK